MYMFTYMYMYIYMCVHTYAYTHIHTYIYIYIHNITLLIPIVNLAHHTCLQIRFSLIPNNLQQ